MTPELRVLIVEDNEFDALLIARELGPEASTLRVDTIETLREALAARAPWDVILTDHSMPQMDAFTVIHEARTAGGNAPVIIVSGLIGEQNVARALVEGATDYVPKSQLSLLKPAIHRATQARAADREREALERERRQFFDLSLDLFAITDLEGRFRMMNVAWTRLLGRSEEDLRREGLRGLVHPNDRPATARAMAALAEGEILHEFETRVIGADGLPHTLVFNAAPFKEARTVYVVARDVTEHRRVEETVRRQERLASLGILVSGIAHEINNPLMYMLGNLEIARSRLEGELGSTDLQPRTRESIEQVVDGLGSVTRGTKRIETIASQLTAIARPAAASHGPMDLNGLVKRAIDAGTAGAIPPPRIHTELAPGATAVGDESEIEQVVVWLLKNAVDATRKTEAPEIRVSTEEARSRVRIVIADNGPGIPPDLAGKLFTPFFTTKANGVGLALAVAHWIARDHGGSLDYAPAPGGGASFTLTLPSSTAPPPAAAPSRVARLPLASRDAARFPPIDAP